MDLNDYLEYVKYNLGLTSDSRDKYLIKIIEGAIGELFNSSIHKEGQSEEYVKEYDEYVIDYASWLYRNRGGENQFPPWLKRRRNNLQIGFKNVQ